MKKIISLFIMAAILSFPLVVHAQNPCFNMAGDRGQIGRCVSQIYIWALGLSGFLGLLMIIIGGYMVMTSRGNAQQASQGKTYVTSALAGIALLLGAYFILTTINPDLVDFRISCIDPNKCEPVIVPPSQ
jgi:hypothetical protein